ncbi:HAD family hydrolase [Campylobacter canadensis]|uniref:phosphoglycolate phosphatase n=1 Tax=Campylobacter canadensis TaxID=449520 RepID=A0ABS7WR42_9BACT|nr:HAD family hydrolase [Campylobacter canadensis]MBZ7986802.1 HAD family hydrolase [Campylobacter canadensis]MBZ7995114.1 HAD family hydrolase [Campylobacter canadensis]MBZ7996604.1 HAD family hydrolase [Campylobacter canadensis]MBZ7997839.1 HAD family hydrolase [Campylobacter canadensis]MBZ8000483.1 HAD family hydrolase [Campylobacter canadensis]
MIIFFDLDGTLIDSTQAIINSLELALKDYGYSFVDSKEAKRLIGISTEDMFSTLGVKDEDIKNIVSAYRTHYAKFYVSHTHILNGAKEAVLLAHKNNATIGLVTTKSYDFSKKILENYGLDKYFSVIVGGDEVSKCKPNAEPILKALTRLKLNDLRCENYLSKEELQKEFDFNKIYMIGDTTNDTKAAKNAGVNALVTLFEYAPSDVMKDEGVLVFNTPLECVEHIFSK